MYSRHRPVLKSLVSGLTCQHALLAPAGTSTVWRLHEETTPCQQEKRQRTDEGLLSIITEQILSFVKQTLKAISELFIDLPNDGSTTVFGARKKELPGRKYVHRPGFQRDPWTRGVIPYPPQPAVSQLLSDFSPPRLANILPATALFTSIQGSYGYQVSP